MAIKVIDHGSDDYKQMIALRQLLLRKPLGLNFSDDELAEEESDILIGCFDEDKLEGCCLLTESAPGVLRLRQMAVISGLQGKGVGRAILQFAENIARDRGYKKMVMHARKTATGFYEKLGYTIMSEEFIEVSIPHYLMEKDL
ncbi:GNAT family N-acetyltransferase [Parafilimonas terrae]|jgi:GNAT superfamily N-acetyltransferase|uniref:Probable N-acetyltransferase 14 n=1 Tax=Parafilimonas terrae TaxID=1465490 RepID=A0A1I5Z3E8_9BACT|nr:GNAT family N-acetyltransferase [Parafilimonas terrae]SFQ50993.1 Acetyltransferase (GNAT) domain-containing protein [Parafilimonas terrae]